MVCFAEFNLKTWRMTVKSTMRLQHCNKFLCMPRSLLHTHQFFTVADTVLDDQLATPAHY